MGVGRVLAFKCTSGRSNPLLQKKSVLKILYHGKTKIFLSIA